MHKQERISLLGLNFYQETILSQCKVCNFVS